MRARLLFVVRRLFKAVFVILGIVVLAFFLIRLAPGDVVDVIAGELQTGDPQVLANIRARYGLDQPVLVQLWRYLSSAVLLDLGYSYRQSAPVATVIIQRLPATLFLATSALVFAMVVGVTLGAMAARRVGKWTDSLISVTALIVYATPAFWLGLMAILLFSVAWPILPSFGMRTPGPSGGVLNYMADVGTHLVLPTLTLGLFFVAVFARLTRAQMLEVADMDFVRTARSKGVKEGRVVRQHILRNALLPVVTVAGFQAGNLMSGTVLIETVYAWPGIGRLAYDAIIGRDYNLLLGIFIISGAIVILFNLITDLLYSVIDPRIELQQ